MRDNISYVYAGFAVRFCAWLVDVLVLTFPLAKLSAFRASVALSDPYGVFSRAVFFRYSIFDILLFLLPVLYFSILTYAEGATLGKMFFKLKVVSADGERLTFWTVLVRELFGRYLSTATFLIGYLMAIPDREKRTLHDRLSYTRVVYNLPAVAAPKAAPDNDGYDDLDL